MNKKLLSLIVVGGLAVGGATTFKTLSFADETSTTETAPVEEQVNTQGQGLQGEIRGQGDTDNDGICEITGNEVGVNQGQGQGQGSRGANRGQGDTNNDGICEITKREVGANQGQGFRGGKRVNVNQ